MAAWPFCQVSIGEKPARLRQDSLAQADVIVTFGRWNGDARHAFDFVVAGQDVEDAIGNCSGFDAVGRHVQGNARVGLAGG